MKTRKRQKMEARADAVIRNGWTPESKFPPRYFVNRKRNHRKGGDE